MKKASVTLKLLGLALLSMGMTACISTGNNDAKTEVKGAAGGSTAKNANSKLQRCPQSNGTVAIDENKEENWFGDLYTKTGIKSTVPLLNLYVQQSGCFVVVNRSDAGMRAMNKERQIARGSEGRADGKYGGGQVIAADYTIIPSINFSANTGGASLGGAIGGLIGGRVGAAVGSAALSTSTVSVTLLLIDNRSGIQVAASEGSAKNFDFAGGLGAALGGGSGAGGLAGGGYTNTPEAKIITAAFADAYNNMVGALIDFKAQSTRGPIGKGGRLKSEGDEDYATDNNQGKKNPKSSKSKRK